MKKTLLLLLGTAILAMPSLALAQGQAGQSQTANSAVISDLITQARTATPEQRATLIRNALQANPSLARELVSQLIAEFPQDAAALTKAVVETVISLPTVSQETKSEILTQVAQASVNAALAIPQGRVESILQTVNAVKNELAQVPAEFQTAVEQYIIPLTPESALLTGTNNQENDPNKQEEQIISPDTL